MFSLERRIKRHVWALPQRFFTVIAPGLEHVCKIELTRRGAENMTVFPGRIEFSGPFELLYKTNLQLRSPDRVFWIIDQFKARRLDKIITRFANTAWELFLYPSVRRSFRFHFRDTDISSNKWLEQRLDDEITRHFKTLPADYFSSVPVREYDQPQIISVSVERDQVQISLDSSGDPLYKRGYRRDGGEAPIRETLAAGIMRHIAWKPSMPLVDAMTGSGTFAIEAAMIAVKRAAGVQRRFQFMDWPSFRETRFRYLKSMAVTTQTKKAPARIIALDKSTDQLDRARHNAEIAGMEKIIEFLVQDFFEVKPATLGIERGCLIMNLPYGKRLSKTKLRPFYYNIGAYLKQHFQGWTIALLYPASDLEPVLGILKARYLTLTSGGTKIRLLSAKIN